MINVGLRCVTCFALVCLATSLPAAVPRELQVGIAGHAFDHLGAFGDQAETAAASGANIIYVTGVGGLGYAGLPAAQALSAQRKATADYLRKARRDGIRLAIGYVCATSIVNLDRFDQHWTPELRSTFHRPPSEWRQQDRSGKPLPSWYGGDYQPACMNNPDWRAYERYIVRLQLEAGCDGIFFDNPTVHPDGCYCGHCMAKFGELLQSEGSLRVGGPQSVKALRELAQRQPRAFLRFRATTARDFLADMRAYARTVKPSALITANNSLNSADVLYSQSRRYGYNIYEMSQAEDLVVVEDMSSQPCTRADGRVVEYGPMYQQLRAISHGKPVVAVTLVESDYHTPPSLMRLAMAEAAANGASYLWWPTWPETERKRMAALVRPQAEFLREHANLLNGSSPRRDVVLFLPFRNWLETEQCAASQLAAELSRANVQFEVICEDHLQPGSEPLLLSGNAPAQPLAAIPKALRGSKVLLAASRYDFRPEELRLVEKFDRGEGALITAEKGEWLKAVKMTVGQASVEVQGAPAVRALVRDQPNRTIVHLLNLNVQRKSSFEDIVTPAVNLPVTVRIPFKKVRSVRVLTADPGASVGTIPFNVAPVGRETVVKLTLPRLEIASLLLIE